MSRSRGDRIQRWFDIEDETEADRLRKEIEEELDERDVEGWKKWFEAQRKR